MTDNEALRIATEAMKSAAKAEQRIADHEATCSQRWGLVIKLAIAQITGVITTLLTVLGALLADKFF